MYWISTPYGGHFVLTKAQTELLQKQQLGNLNIPSAGPSLKDSRINTLQPMYLFPPFKPADGENPLFDKSSSSKDVSFGFPNQEKIVSFQKSNGTTFRNPKKHCNMTPKKREISERVVGKVYVIRGVRKRWNGRRFTRCCVHGNCEKLAQGTTKLCKAHGGGRRCRVSNCKEIARGHWSLCANHKRLVEKLMSTIRTNNNKTEQKPVKREVIQVIE